jgi:hypothetical protein
LAEPHAIALKAEQAHRNARVGEKPHALYSGMRATPALRAYALVLSLCATASAAFDPLPQPDFSKIKPSDFSDDELDLPWFLRHFHHLADAVVAGGPDRGFFDTGLWRGERQKHTYNARIMESHTSLAYFYCTDRPWNVYYRSAAVRQRLEAALDRLCRMQNDDGRFSEYGEGQWNLPATAFATKFLGETIRLLRTSGAPIDPGLLKRVVEADRKAILATLTQPALYEHGKRYTNQYCNVFAGGMAYLDLYPDDEIRRLLLQQFKRATEDFQSPAGFYYERDGPDFGYVLHTTHSDMVMAYHYARGTELGRWIEQTEAKWAEWLSYNCLRQPDGSGFVVNRGIETRQRRPFFTRQDTAMAENVETSRAFCTSRQELEQQQAEARQAVQRDWEKYLKPSRKPDQPFTPYDFLHRAHYRWLPTHEQQAAAVAKLPYLARESFTHQRSDSRKPLVCTYVRRPTYYAAFNAGEPRHEQQRFGLGILWHPAAGAVIQSQTGSSDFAWGTRREGAEGVYEAGKLLPEFTVAGKAVRVEPGCRDLPAGPLVVSYPVGDAGRKTVTFDGEAITVEVAHAGAFTEHIPLLLRPDQKPMIAAGQATLGHGRRT